MIHDLPQPADANPFRVLSLDSGQAERVHHGYTLAEAWAEYGAEIVERWAVDHPGTRPTCWWRFTAPKLTPEHPIVQADALAWPALLADLPAPRLRLGGTGTPDYERLAIVPEFQRGLPVRWITDDLLRTYELIGSPLDVPAYDPLDRPVYESEPANLRRLDLLLPGEAARLPADAFDPEAVTMQYAD